MIDFIGIGAQRTGTSWLYACLYEHPEICAPIKEIHFFSRPRYEKGIEWYESHFTTCAPGTKKGEFSTSYLYSDTAAERIHEHYPNAKILVTLRNPVERAVSQYGNDIKGGHIPESMPLERYLEEEKSALEQGLYAAQLKRYLENFDRSQIYVAIYEDAQKNPKKFVSDMYRFLGVDASFTPSMLYQTINNTRVPKHIGLERGMHYISEFLRKSKLDKLVHMIRRSGIPDFVRKHNTKASAPEYGEKFDEAKCGTYFAADTAELSRLLNRDLLTEWNISSHYETV